MPLAAVVVLLWGGAGSVRAQVDPEALGGATSPDADFPGLEDLDRERDEASGRIRESAAASPPPGADEIRIRLDALQIDGMTVYPQSAFEPLYGPLLGREASLGDLYRVAAKIQARYRADGYFLSRVIVPAQEAASGVFRLQAVEGFVSRVDYEGAEHPSFRLARGYLSRAIRERPLRLKTLEHGLLLANDIPGLTVSVLLRQSPEAPGAAVLVMLIERDSAAGFFGVDNQGSVFTGRDTVAGRVTSRARTRFGEELGLTVVVSDPFKPLGNIGVRGDAGMALGRSGLRLESYVTYGESRPGFLLETLNTKSESIMGGLGVVMPFKRSRDLSLTGALAFEMLNTTTDSFGFTVVEDSIRTVSLKGRADWNDRFGGTGRGTVEVRRGLPILDHSEASFLNSREGATGVFTSVRAEIERVQRITRAVSVKTGIYGQYAADNVLSAEEFTAGGRRYGRGYNHAEASGDHGVAASLEVRYGRAGGSTWLDSYQVFGFVDFAKAWRNDQFFFLVDDHDALVSAGAGVRARLFDRVSLEFTLAKPLTRPTYRGADEGKGRFPQPLVRVTTTF